MFGLPKHSMMSAVRQSLDVLPIDLLIVKFICVSMKLLKRHPITRDMLESINDFNNCNLKDDHQLNEYIKLIKSSNYQSPLILNLIKVCKCVKRTLSDIISNPEAVIRNVYVKFYEGTDSLEFKQIDECLTNFNLANKIKIKKLIYFFDT
jgi:hypothetical protein